MRSDPMTLDLDLTAPDVVADPYPHFAAERAPAAVAWHEPSGMFLTFTHADGRRRCSATGGSGRLWQRQGAAGRTSSRSTCCTATR